MAAFVYERRTWANSQCGVAGGLTNMGVSSAGIGIGVGVLCL